VIGKSIANRPYMYLPLKGDTNDYSTNAQNPSNTGVTTTTGQFGESNGAYEWDSSTDRLSWSSSIGNTVATMLNNQFTMMFFSNANGIQDQARFLNQLNNISSQYSFQFTYSSTNNASSILFVNTSTTYSTFNDVDNMFSTTDFVMVAYSTEKISSDIHLKQYSSGVLLDTQTTTIIPRAASTTTMNLGMRPGVNDFGKIGKLHCFRIYNVTLSDGALKILNNEKGRIRA